jgi:hypothetical protein
VLSSEQELDQTPEQSNFHEFPCIHVHIDGRIKSVLTIILILVFVNLEEAVERKLLLVYNLNVQLM